MRLRRLVARCSILPLLASPLIAGEASGKFTSDKLSITPTAATAYEVRDQADGRKLSVEVLLGGAALDSAELAEALDPHVYAINSEASKGDYILIWAHADGSASMNATFSETMTQYIDDTKGGLKVEWTERTADRVAGRVWSPKPVKPMSGASWTVDMTFAATVTRPPAGTKLAADGGDPGKALTALYHAVDRKDWMGIQAGVAPDRMSALEKEYNSAEENLEEAVEMLADFWLPKKSRILGGELRGDAAILEVEGELYPGAKWLFLVKMVQGEAGWQFSEKVPAGRLK
jgi:hypothetical protein